MANASELAADLGATDQVKAYQAMQALTKLCGDLGASGREADRAAAAKDLAAALAAVKPAKDKRGEPTLESMHSVSTVNEICRALALVAGEAEVAVLAACLKDIDLREPARWCLARMTCQGAADALAECLKTATGTEFRVGLINALGRKTGSNVVEALKSATTDNEPEVRLAAAEALANTADASLDSVIAGVDPGRSTRRAARVAAARVRLGNTLLASGNDTGSLEVFKAVAAAEVPETQKKAAAAAVAK